MDQPIVRQSSHATCHWHTLQDGRVQCDVCPRECKLHEGQRGLCFVRGCMDGKLVLTTYDRSSGFCVDPIEKKPLNHFYPGSPVFSFGTAGCNLACKFCQNYDISKSRETDTLADFASPLEIVQTARRYHCKSIAFTYNDPVIFMEYALEVATLAREQGLQSVAVTAGYINDAPRKEFFAGMDAANVDLKSFSEDFYHKITGAHLQPVLETLLYIKNHTKVWLEITTLLIEGYNDSDQELSRLSAWIADNLGPDVPLHFSAFHPAWKLMDAPPTSPHTLQRARDIAMRTGLRYVYTGNIRDVLGQSTYCHQCGECLIERDGYVILAWNLTSGGKCSKCGGLCAGVFEDRPGAWGNRRLPVAIHRENSGFR